MIRGLISVSALRETIGGPTLDTSEPGYVTDAMLQDIVDRHETAMVESMSKIAFQMIAQGQQIAPDSIFSHVALAVTHAGPHQNLSSANIPTGFFPYIRSATTSTGKTLRYDPEITLSANTSFFPVYRFFVTRDKVLISPKFNGSISAQMVRTEDLVSAMVSADSLIALNNAIIQEAYGLLQRRIQEGTRLEAPYIRQ